MFLSPGQTSEIMKQENANGHAKFPASRSVDETRWRDRRVSGGSMPGSLPKSTGYLVDSFEEEMESEDESEELRDELEQEDRGDRQSIPEDEIFLEDLYATGEMKNVPFL